MSYTVGTAEWLEERRSYLGASEMAGALGLSPWDDPISVWERKIGEAAVSRCRRPIRRTLGSLGEGG